MKDLGKSMSSDQVSKSRLVSAIPISFWLTVVLSPMLLLIAFWFESWSLADLGQLLAALGFTTWVLVYRWNHVLRLPNTKLSIGLVLGMAGIQLWGAIFWQPWFGAIAIALAWLGFCLCHIGKDHSNLWAYAGLGLLFVRLPQFVDALVEAKTSQYLLHVASYILDRLKVANDSISQRLVITSGVVEESPWEFMGYSLYVFVAICWVVFLRKNYWLILYYGAAAILVGFFSKLLWLVVTAKLNDSTAGGVLPKNVSFIIDAVCLIAGLLLFLSLDGLLQVVFHPIEDRKAGRKVTNPLLALWDHMMIAVPLEEHRKRERWLASAISKPNHRIVWISSFVAVLMVLTIVPQTWHAWKHWRAVGLRSEPAILCTQAMLNTTPLVELGDRTPFQFCFASRHPNNQATNAKGAN